MSGRFTNPQELHIDARGTGSIYFGAALTPYLSIAVTKVTASCTVESIELLGSNYSDHNGNPRTGSVDSRYWAVMDEVTFTAMTSSAAPGTQIVNLGNVVTKHLQLRAYTKTGGIFYVAIHGKE